MAGNTRSVVSVLSRTQDPMGTYGDKRPLSLQPTPGDLGAASNQLGLLVLFSHPNEMHKAYEYLSGIACTIQFTAQDPPAPIAGESNAPPKAYSARECDVLTLLAKGYSYSETATCLGCKLSTVQTHVKHLYAKLGVHSRAQAVHEALQMGLIKI